MSEPTQRIDLPDVGDDVNDALARLVPALDKHRTRNARLDARYDAKSTLRKLFGGVIPDQYYLLGLVLGWSAKAVDALARRCNLDAMVWPDGKLEDTEYAAVWDDNRIGSETDQAITDALVHGLAFAVATDGIESGGGAEDRKRGYLHFYSAGDATGERNVLTRRLDNLLIANDRDDEGRIIALSLLLDGVTIAAVKDGTTWEVLSRVEHRFGVPAAPMVYRPRLRRPMGRTRLTPPLRGLQDAAVRAMVRLEGHMDVYAFPEFWLLGAGLDVFRDEHGNLLSEMQRRLGRMKGIPDDVDLQDVPQLARADVKYFPASDPSPHLAALNAYAKLYAREASLPDSAVAITDLSNPQSAESYDAAQYELVAEAEGACREFSPALRHVVPIAMAMQAGLSEVPGSWRSIDTRWRNPRFLSRSAEADAGSKQVAAAPWLAETTVGLGLLGLDEQQIKLALGERKRAEANARMDALIAVAQGAPAAPAVPSGDEPAPPTAAHDAAALKVKFDALGIAIRAGVKPGDAAARLGLSGIQFTGAVPVSLRPTERNASALEGR